MALADFNETSGITMSLKLSISWVDISALLAGGGCAVGAQAASEAMMGMSKHRYVEINFIGGADGEGK
jgi:hypothetical protein